MIELFRKIYFSTRERKKTLLNERLTFIIPESMIALIAGRYQFQLQVVPGV